MRHVWSSPLLRCGNCDTDSIACPKSSKWRSSRDVNLNHWLQTHLGQFALLHQGEHCRITKKSSRGSSVESSPCWPLRECVEWEDGDPEACFPLEWPVGALAHSLWPCFIGASQSQNEGLDSVLRWSLKFFPVEVFLPTKDVESLKVVLPPRPVPGSHGFMC